MKRVYLLAHPAGHSLSPQVQNAAFAQLEMDVCYEALDVPPAKLEAAVERLRDEEVLGANVTVPHKLRVMPLLDELTAAAETIGAVNTVINDEGWLLGHNTDAPGFFRALTEAAHFDPVGKRAVLLGAGGAARAVAYALLSAGVADLSIYNRTFEKAQTLAGALSELGAVRALRAGELEALERAELLINATSVGMEHEGQDPDCSPLPPGLLPRRALVCDIVYRPARSRLLRDAAAAGLAVQNGLPMLVYQGVESFRAWTGREASAKVMLEAARGALSRG